MLLSSTTPAIPTPTSLPFRLLPSGRISLPPAHPITTNFLPLYSWSFPHSLNTHRPFPTCHTTVCPYTHTIPLVYRRLHLRRRLAALRLQLPDYATPRIYCIPAARLLYLPFCATGYFILPPPPACCLRYCLRTYPVSFCSHPGPPPFLRTALFPTPFSTLPRTFSAPPPRTFTAHCLPFCGPSAQFSSSSTYRSATCWVTTRSFVSGYTCCAVLYLPPLLSRFPIRGSSTFLVSARHTFTCFCCRSATPRARIPARAPAFCVVMLLLPGRFVQFPPQILVACALLRLLLHCHHHTNARTHCLPARFRSTRVWLPAGVHCTRLSFTLPCARRALRLVYCWFTACVTH